jgi:hypothetical protein
MVGVMYLIGMMITFIVVFTRMYFKFRKERAMLPEIESIFVNLVFGEKAILVLSVMFWPIAILFCILYHIIETISIIPKTIIKVIVNLVDARHAKIYEGRIALLYVGQIIKLVRWSELKDNENFTIQAINEDTISGNSTTVLAGTFPKKNIVLVDDELYLLERPYSY